MFNHSGNTPRKGDIKIKLSGDKKVSLCTVSSPLSSHASSLPLLSAVHRNVRATAFELADDLQLYPHLLIELHARVCGSRLSAAAVSRAVAACALSACCWPAEEVRPLPVHISASVLSQELIQGCLSLVVASMFEWYRCFNA